MGTVAGGQGLVVTSPRTALITGASSGIGRATALLLAAEGASLVLLARGRSALETTADQCRAAGAAGVVVAPCDLLDRDAVADVVGRAGPLDLVVHSATVMAYGDVEDLPADVFDHVVDTAIKGTANLARPVLAGFRRRGRGDLVVVSSLLASITAPTMGAYATAKWGQLGLVRTLQQETRDVPGIRIAAVSRAGSTRRSTTRPRPCWGTPATHRRRSTPPAGSHAPSCTSPARTGGCGRPGSPTR